MQSIYPRMPSQINSPTVHGEITIKCPWERASKYISCPCKYYTGGVCSAADPTAQCTCGRINLEDCKLWPEGLMPHFSWPPL